MDAAGFLPGIMKGLQISSQERGIRKSTSTTQQCCSSDSEILLLSANAHMNLKCLNLKLFPRVLSTMNHF